MELKEKLARLTELNKERSEQLSKNQEIWTQKVDKLYEDITNWFAEYIQEGYMTYDYEEQSLVEYNENELFALGDVFCLNLGGKQSYSVVFVPTGMNVVGAVGKIDLYFRGHKKDGVFLLLMEEDEQLLWKIWKSRKQQVAKFNQESFEKLIDEWLDKWTYEDLKRD